MATIMCIIQLNTEFWFLYVIRIISHVFENYNLFCITIYFILFNLITFYFEKFRNLFFIILVSIILGIVLNDHELRGLFIYKNQPIDQNFYVYLTSYTIVIVLWCIMLKKLWKNVL
ncbi:hypothetical protein ASG22_16990 [Chryseobacterium sp. Leaf405]|nr:hypothetical protein ASG22_16990 [Chryseobacterium sp. Leaf405]